MKKLSFKKSVLSIGLAGLLLTSYATIDKSKHFSPTSSPNIVKIIVEEVSNGLNKISRLINNAARVFAPTGTTAGLVYRDHNGNGTREAAEPLLAGVTVNLYTASNPTSPCGTTISTSSGWTVTSGTCSGNLRVEFVLPTTFGTGINDISATDFAGPTGGSSVQFVADGSSNVNFGLMNPEMYSQSNPKMATAMYQASGDGALSAMQTWSYNNVGTTGDASSLATMGQIGSTWGLAYDKVKRNLYSAAVLKAHIPLGPEGLDAIYVTNTATGTTSKFVELQDDLGIPVSSTTAEPQYLTNAVRQVNDTGTPENDAQAFQDVGKVGLGDIEISADGKILYVVNLFNKTVYAINIASKLVVGTYAVPNPNCSGGTFRPWGLGEKNGQLFVGVICDGSTSGNNRQIGDQTGVNNLTATVYKLSSGSFSSVLSYSLNYPKENPFEYSNICNDLSTWKPWADAMPQLCADQNVAYATPILTDIEFDDLGNIIMGFTDRTGFQYDAYNYGPTGSTIMNLYVGGDILRACVNTNGTGWSIESVSSSCASTTGGPGNNGGQAINTTDTQGYFHANAGPTTNPKPGEFFWGDYFHENGDISGNTSWFPGHPEITIGGLAVLPGSNEVLSTAYDPVTGGNNYNTGGVIALSTTTGAKSRNGFQLYSTPEMGIGSPTGGKGVGLGDLEILSDPAPIELGNRIWNDTNGNGIQDPGEAIIAGVTLELFLDADNDGTPDGPAIGTSTTDVNGNYIFKASNVADGDPTIAGNQPGPAAFTNYIIRVAASDWSGGAGTGDLTGLTPTLTNVDGAGQPDVRDSDGTKEGDFLQIKVTTGNMGESNHTLDFGFEPSLSLGSTAFIDLNNDGIQSGVGETGIDGLTVNLYAAANPMTVIATTTTAGGGHYFFNGLAAGNYIVGVVPNSSYPVASTPVTANSGVVGDTDGVNTGTQVGGSGESKSGSIALSAGTQPITDTAAGATGLTAANANGNATIDFGFVPTVSIGSLVYQDNSNDGTFNGTDAPLAGATVTLYEADGVTLATDANGAAIAPITTLANGLYYFGNLLPGNYVVGVTPPATAPVSSTTTVTTDDNGGDGLDNGTQAASGDEAFSPVISLSAGTEPTTEAGAGGTSDDASGDTNGDMTVDFGFVPTVSIGSLVYQDNSNDGTFNGTDAPLSGATVTLYEADGVTPATDANGAAIAPITTLANGLYYFGNLLPGNYVVGVTPPATAPVSSTTTVTTDDNGGDGLDNGTQAASGDEAFSPVISLSAGTEPTTEAGAGGTSDDASGDTNGDMTVDFGFVPTVSIGSLVYQDNSNDGTFNGTDAPLSGATVTLYEADGVTPATDANGAAIAPITTLANGLYYFGNLLPGNYVVGVTPPATAPVSSTTTVTTDDNGGDGLDNGTQAASGDEAFSPVISLSAGTEPTTEAGAGGTSDDASGDTNGDMTVDFGFVPTVSIGSLVYQDNSNDGTFNGTDAPLAGATVTLYEADGVTLATDANGAAIAPITTLANGLYYFGNLLPGNYVVGVTPPATTPVSSTTTVTTDDNGGDGLDNGTQAASGDEAFSPVISLAAGTEPTTEAGAGGTSDDASGDTNGDMTVDFGFVPTVSIGSLVYQDNSNDGTFNGTDAPLSGATVTLYEADGVTPATDANGAAIAPITTLANGLYYFGNLLPGDYVVGVTPPATAPVSSTTTVTTDDNGGDGLDNGTQAASGDEAFSPVISLSAGTEPTTEAGAGGTSDDASGDTNGDMTVDFGFVPTVSIGSLVYQDNSNDGTFNGTDAPLSGATVTLYEADGVTPATDANGAAIAPITTLANGLYYFGNLLPGNYVVGVTPPATAPVSSTTTVTTDDNGGDGLDNGTQAASGDEAFSPVISLSAGTEPTTEAGAGGTSDDASGDTNGDMTVDFGFVPTVSIGSLVYQDNSNDGTFNGTDAPLSGATVTLYEADGVTPATDANGAAIAPITTLANGLYYFGNLLPGNYVVGVTPPATTPVSSTTTVTTDDNGGDGLDNGTQAASGDEAFSPVISLAAGTEPTTEAGAGGTSDDASGDTNGDMTVDFGFVPTVSIGSLVYQDNSNDGTFNGTDAPLSGATVTLYEADGVTPATDANGAAIAPITTLANGLYYFGNLLPGDYVVGVTPPATAPVSSTTTVTTDDNGGDGLDNGTQAASGDEAFSPVISLSAGTEPTTEAGAGGTSDDASGDTNGDMTVDFGFVPTVSIGSLVYQDNSNDGTFNGTDAPLSGATVTLYEADGVTPATDANGAAIAPITTLANGLYYFGNLLPGNYVVGVTPPATTPVSSTTTVTTDDNGGDGLDNGTQAASGDEAFSPVISLSAGTEPTTEAGAGGTSDDASGDTNGDMTVDFGFVPTVSIGSLVYQDNSNDGTFNGTDAPLSGATVTLYEADGVTPATDANGAAIAPITTLANGLYYFGNLLPGNYVVGVTPPATAPVSSTTTVTTDDNGGDGLDNGTQAASGDEAFSPVISLSAGTEPTTEAGAGGTSDDASGDTNGDMTVDFGFVPTVSIGSLVYQDNSNDGTFNGTDAPLAGATVTLYEADGVTLATDANGAAIAPITTLANGLYYFGNLLPGNYVVGVTPPATAPVSSTTTVTTDDNGGDGLDNGTQAASGDEAFSPVISLSAGTEPTTEAGAGGTSDDASGDTNGDMTVDFGFVPTVSIGSLVYQDNSNDGTFNGTDAPLSGATVTLYEADGVTPATDANGAAIAPITTLANGLYYFGNLLPGNYVVGVTPPATAPVSSTTTVTTDDNGGDGLDNGTQAASGDEAFSPVISLSAGTEPTTEAGAGGTSDDASGDTNGDMTVDFGFVPTVSIGSLVYQDNSNDGTFNGTDAPLSGATVTLYEADGVTPATDANGAAIAPITTLANGLYYFGNLLPGNYVVGVTPPATAPVSSTTTVTTDDNGGDGLDNGTQAASGDEAFSPVISLSAGTEPTTEAGAGGTSDDASGDTNGDMTVDFGFVPTVSIGSLVYQDNSNDGTFNGTDAPLAGATVTLYEADGVTLATDANGAAIAPITTLANGLYYFGNLLPGNYVVGVTPPATTPVSSTTTVTTDDNGGDGLDNGTQAASGDEAFSPVISLAAGTEPTTEAGAGGTSDDASGDTNGDMTVDFGFVPTVSIGSLVYQDNSNDGTFNGTDAPLSGATVTLYEADGVTPATDANGAAIAPITTLANGLYYFGNLLPGDYVVGVTPPATAPVSSTTTVTTDDNGGDGLDNGTQAASGDEAFSPVISLSAGTEPTTEAGAGGTSDDASGDTNGDMTVDFGFVPTVSIGSLVYQDNSNDGTFNGTDAPLSGATVTLYEADGVTPATDANGAAIAPITTLANGLYYFGNLLPGNYVVGVTPPATAPVSSTTTVTTDDNGGDGLDNGTQAASGDEAFSPVISLSAGTEPTTEAGAGGTSDDASGDTNGDMTVDFGFVPTVSIGSLVYQDNSNDGTFNGTDAPLSGATVTLYEADGVTPATDANGAAIAPITTLANGLYYFGNLLPGNYVVGVTPPATTPVSSTTTVTTDDNGGDGLDNGTQAASGDEAFSPVISLAAGTEPTTEAGAGGTSDDASGDTNGDMTVDFGFVPTVSIGSLVYQDNSNDGTFNGTDAPLSGATVTLYEADGVTPATDANGAAIAPITTLANGLYYFGNLLPGDYVVGVTPPATAPVSSTTTVTTDDNGGDGLDNGTQAASGDEAFSPVISLSAGTEPTTEAGAGGTSDDASGDTNGDMTVDFGFVPTVSIGSLVYQDNSNDGTFNGTDAPLSGATVTLYEADGVTPATDANGAAIAPITTLANGLYYFGNLLPGNYVVGVTPPATTPVSSTTTVTTDDNGGDGLDNGTQAASGDEAFSPVISLSAGTEPTTEAGAGGTSDDASGDTNGDMTVDFGFVPTVSIGSLVYQDNSNDGTFNGTDAPLSGATVTLYEADGVTPATDANGAAIAPITTLANGLYYFGNLLPGNYVVGVTPPATAPVSSTTTVTTDDNGGDGLDNGTQAASGDEAFSPVISLSAGTEPTTEAGAGGTSDDASGDTNGDMTVDFGFVPTVSIGSLVYQDNSNDGTFNGTDAPLSGATVTLYEADGVTPATDANGAAIAPITTLANGLYYFGNLLPGNYVVGVTPPATTPVSSTTTVTTDDNGGDGLDNGTQAASGDEAFSPVISLAAGTEPTTEAGAGGTSDDASGDTNGDMTVDFGFLPTVSIGSLVYQDNSNDGTFNGTDAPLSGATVTLYEADGVTPATDANGAAIAPITTLANGLYYFGNLLPGDYVVGVTPPATAPVSSTTTVTTDDNGGDGLDNGTQAASGDEAFSPVISLSAGTEPTTEAGAGGTSDDASGDTNGDMTVDFGFFEPVNVSGNVFIDTNGITAVDGAPYPAPANTLYAILVDAIGNIAGSAPIGTDGKFEITNVAPGTYTSILSTSTPMAIGTVAPTVASIPSGYFSIAEGIGTTPDAAGIGNSIMTTPIVVLATDVPNINFGINTQAPLPVDLVNFLATQFDEQINLDWKTANEKQFSHFELQRSENAKEFGSIATVNTNGISQYNYADINPIEGINYYRLKMVDIDGTSKLSKVISVNFEKGASFVSVENPANNGEFKAMTNLKNAKFTLLNSLGTRVNLLINVESNNIYRMRTQAPAGLYYLNIESNGKLITRKIVLQ